MSFGYERLEYSDITHGRCQLLRRESFQMDRPPLSVPRSARRARSWSRLDQEGARRSARPRPTTVDIHDAASVSSAIGMWSTLMTR